MKIKHRQVPFKVKSLDANGKGTISGYGSVFGNLDAYRDVIQPGAFQKSLGEHQANDSMPAMLWQHDSAQPIGVWQKMSEDGNGLLCEGQLLVDDVPMAAQAYALLQAKALRGLSIGYNVPDGGMEYDGKTNVWKVNQVELWEVSVVTFPANTDATVTAVKKIIEEGEWPSIKEFENLLRDAGGFSKKQATAIASHGYANFLRQRDAGDGEQGDSALFDEVLASIKSYKSA